MADLAYWEVYHMNQIEARKHSTCAKRSLAAKRPALAGKGLGLSRIAGAYIFPSPPSFADGLPTF